MYMSNYGHQITSKCQLVRMMDKIGPTVVPMILFGQRMVVQAREIRTDQTVYKITPQKQLKQQIGFKKSKYMQKHM